MKEFTDLIGKFKQRNKESIVSAYQELLVIVQQLPNLVQSCSTIQSSIEKLTKKVLQVVDLPNFAKNVGINLAFHSVKIMGELAKGLQSLNEGDYYGFGYSVGKALDMLT